MEIGVVIPCFNAADTIGEQLESLNNQQWSDKWEVIVVDNRSKDGSMKIVNSFRNRLTNIKIVEAYDKQGAPYALNIGVQSTNAEAILFCDADDVVGDGWLENMGNALKEHDFVACRFEVNRLNPQKPKGGAPGNPQGEGLQKIWYPPYLPHAGGGTLGIKKRLHQRVGGFDESLLYLQDTDYCFRVQLAGTPLYFVAGARVHVRHRKTLAGVFRQSFNYAEYNVILFKRYRSMAPEKPHLWKDFLYDWQRLAKLLPKYLEKNRRDWFAWNLGRQMGRLKGIVKQRVPPV